MPLVFYPGLSLDGIMALTTAHPLDDRNAVVVKFLLGGRGFGKLELVRQTDGRGRQVAGWPDLSFAARE